MKTIKNFLNNLKHKNIHLVGVTGAEISSILNLLVSQGIKNITAHDFSERKYLEKNYKIWHKGLSVSERNRQFAVFKNNLEKILFFDAGSYLNNIEDADIIFVPQSWRLYPSNRKLFSNEVNKIPFYSLTRLYLDYSPARIVAVTGTVGKGSVASLLYNLLDNGRSKVWFAGNETWKIQLAENLISMTPEDLMILEISHRQLQDGFARSPSMVVFTNLYPNHLDELSWEKYAQIKLSLLKSLGKSSAAVINYDDPLLRKTATRLNTKVLLYSQKYKNMNIKDVQHIYNILLKTKSDHYIINILAASTAAIALGVFPSGIPDRVFNIPPLPARLERAGFISGINIIDDIKSTTPWSTLAAVEKIKNINSLILVGDTKKIDYTAFCKKLKEKDFRLIVLESPLSLILKKYFSEFEIRIVTDLENAFEEALKNSKKGDSILISPAAANFYSRFIKGKKSIRKIISSFD